MSNVPQEAPAAVRQGDGHEAKAPVKNVKVTQEAELKPGQILCKINWTGKTRSP